MEILELAHHREPGLQHLDVKLGGHGLQVLGRKPECEAIHGLAPGPETVCAWPGALGEAQHEALVGVGMDVRHGGNGNAGDALAAPAIGDVVNHAIGTDGHRHV